MGKIFLFLVFIYVNVYSGVRLNFLNAELDPHEYGIAVLDIDNGNFLDLYDQIDLYKNYDYQGSFSIIIIPKNELEVLKEDLLKNYPTLGYNISTAPWGGYTKYRKIYNSKWNDVSKILAVHLWNNKTYNREFSDFEGNTVVDTWLNGNNPMEGTLECIGSGLRGCLNTLNTGKLKPRTWKTNYDLPQHIVNGSFENGDQEWEFGKGVTISDDHGLIAKDGHRSLLVHIEPNSDINRIVKQNVRIIPEHTYKLSFYYRSFDQSLSGNIISAFPSVLQTIGNQQIIGKQFIGSKNWNRFEMIFQANSGSENTWISLLNLSEKPTNPMDFAFDRVELVDISDKYSAKSFDLLDQATLDSWTNGANGFVYLANPFITGAPRFKGNDDDWADTEDPRSKMKLIDIKCNLWVYPFKKDNAPNFMFYNYDLQRYYHSYWLNGLNIGHNFGIYFQPSNSDIWVIPENWSKENAYKGFSSEAIVSNSPPSNISECRYKNITDYGIDLKNDVIQQSYQAEIEEKPRRVYVLSPWQDQNGNYLPPQFSGEDNNGNTTNGDVGSRMRVVDQKCGLYAYVFQNERKTIDWFFLYDYLANGSYRSIKNSGATSISNFLFPNDVDEFWVNPNTSNSSLTTTPASNSKVKPIDVLNERGCEFTSIEEADIASTDESNPRMGESWTIHNAQGATLIAESWEPGRRQVVASNVDGLNHTIGNLLPVSMSPKTMKDLDPTIDSLTQRAIKQYSGQKGADDKEYTQHYVWSENQFDDDPLMRPNYSRPAGRAWAENSKSTNILYVCGDRVRDDDTSLIHYAMDCDNVHQFSGTMSRNIQGDLWSFNFKNSKGNPVQSYNIPVNSNFSSSNGIIGDVIAKTDMIYDGRERLIRVWHPKDANGKRFTSDYTYDQQNRKITEATVDAGINHFIYDTKGKIRFTYNEKLIDQNGRVPVSYIKYDVFDRPKETGILSGSTVESTALSDQLIYNAETDPDFPESGQLVRSKLYYDSCVSANDACISKNTPINLIYVDQFNNTPVKGAFTDLESAMIAISDRVSQGLPVSNKVVILPKDGSFSPPSGTVYTKIPGKSLQISISDLNQTKNKTEFENNIKPQLKMQSDLMLQRPELFGKLVRTEIYNPEIGSNSEPIVESYDYDYDGNKIMTKQENPWLANTSEHTQIVTSDYDFLKRPIQTTLFKNNGQKILSQEKPVYDSKGRVKKVYNQDGILIVENTYDDLGRLSRSNRQIGIEAVFQDVFTYNPFGQIVSHSTRFGNSTGLLSNWNERSTNVDDPTAPRFDGLIASYSFDNANNSPTKFRAQYDELSRLTQVTPIQNATDFGLKMAYADDGSLLNLFRGTNATQPINDVDYIYADDSHKLQAVGGKSMQGLEGRQTVFADKPTFRYDGAGRMIRDESKGMDITGWREDDQLPTTMIIRGLPGSWDQSPTKMNFAYAGGSRIGRWTYGLNGNSETLREARFYTLGGKEIRLGADGQIRSILYPVYAGAARRTVNTNGSSSDEFMVKDRLGSTVRSWSYVNGQVRTNMAADYDAWGKQMHLQDAAGQEELAQRFTGKERDRESGLDYYPARYRDADVGYWISPDAARQFPNLYGYGTNPLNSVDPDGNFQFDDNVTDDQKADVHTAITNIQSQKMYPILNTLSSVFCGVSLDEMFTDGKGVALGLYSGTKGEYAHYNEYTDKLWLDNTNFDVKNQLIFSSATLLHESMHAASYYTATGFINPKAIPFWSIPYTQKYWNSLFMQKNAPTYDNMVNDNFGIGYTSEIMVYGSVQYPKK